MCSSPTQAVHAVQSAARSKQRKVRFIELLEGQVAVLQQQLTWLQHERDQFRQQLTQIGERSLQVCVLATNGKRQ